LNERANFTDSVVGRVMSTSVMILKPGACRQISKWNY